MNRVKQLVLAVISAALMLVSIPAVASAATTSSTNTKCSVSPVNATSLYEIDRNFTYNNNGTVTAQFKVEGDAGCTKDVVFASWKAPSRSGYPLKDQTLYDFKTANFGVGVHNLTIKMPNCYWQLDLLEGTKPTAADGSADYGFGKVHMLDTAHGGTQSCTETPVTPVTPVTPTAPVTPAAVTQTVVTSVPSTGAESIVAGTMGVGATTGLAYKLVDSKRKLKSLFR